MFVVLLVVWTLLVLMLVLHFVLMVWMFGRRRTVCVLQHIQERRNRELCYLLVVGGLRIRAAALLHLLPPLSHRSVQITEIT